MSDAMIGGIGALVLGVLVILLIGEKFRVKVNSWFIRESPFPVLLPAVALLFYNCLITVIGGVWSSNKYMIVVEYFLAPTSVLFALRLSPLYDLKSRSIPMILAVLLWIPVELKYVFNGWDLGGVAYPYVTLSAMVYALALVPVFAKDDFSLSWSWRWNDLRFVLAVFGVMAIFMIPATLFTGFVKFGISDNARKYPFIVPLIWFMPALVEELIFRGIIQNSLIGWTEKLGKYGGFIGWIFASVIFGASHINNGTSTGFKIPNYHYVFFATIAGAGYGLVYWVLKNPDFWPRFKRLFGLSPSANALGMAATFHGLVDIVWVVVFGGR